MLTRYGNGIVLASSNIYTYVLHCTYACMLITLTLSMFAGPTLEIDIIKCILMKFKLLSLLENRKCNFA